MTEPPEDPAKLLWRQQDAETPIMTTLAVRALARGHAERIRNQLLLGYVLAGVLALRFGFMAFHAPNMVARCGYLLIIAGLGWMIWCISLQRPGRMPDAGASASTLIAFHRAELKRQKKPHLYLLIAGGPMIAGMLVVLLGLQQAHPIALARGVIPFLGLLALWFVAGWFLQRRQAGQIQRQIDELDEMEGR